MVSREDFRCLVSSPVWQTSAIEKYVLLAMDFLPTLPFQEMYYFQWLDHYTFLSSNTNWHLLMGITVILQVWFKWKMIPDPCAIPTQFVFQYSQVTCSLDHQASISLILFYLCKKLPSGSKYVNYPFLTWNS